MRRVQLRSVMSAQVFVGSVILLEWPVGSKVTSHKQVQCGCEKNVKYFLLQHKNHEIVAFLLPYRIVSTR